MSLPDPEPDPDVFVIDHEGRLRWSRPGPRDLAPEMDYLTEGPSERGVFREILSFRPTRPDLGQLELTGTRGRYRLRWSPGYFTETVTLELLECW